MRRWSPAAAAVAVATAATLGFGACQTPTHAPSPRRPTAAPRSSRDHTAPPTNASAGAPIPASGAADSASEPAGDPNPAAPSVDGDPVAAQVALAYAVAAWTVQPGDGPRAWITAVAAYTTPAYQARLDDGAATGGATTPPATTAVRITGVTPLAPDAGEWRFQVALVATTDTARGPREVGVSMLIDLDATPRGPRVVDAQ
jgi:hypothetical protein